SNGVLTGDQAMPSQCSSWSEDETHTSLPSLPQIDRTLIPFGCSTGDQLSPSQCKKTLSPPAHASFGAAAQTASSIWGVPLGTREQIPRAQGRMVPSPPTAHAPPARSGETPCSASERVVASRQSSIQRVPFQCSTPPNAPPAQILLGQTP